LSINLAVEIGESWLFQDKRSGELAFAAEILLLVNMGAIPAANASSPLRALYFFSNALASSV